MSVLVVGVILIFREPVRRQVLTILRAPFVVTKTCISALLLLPRLPALAQENATLRAELIQRQLETAQLRETLRHTQHAHILLSTAAPSGQGLVATVIGRSPLPTQHTLLLDKGARDGLDLESVIVDTAGLIGRVREGSPSSCLVILLTDPESRIAALVERTRETGLVVGRGRGQCELVYLDLHAEVAEGDRVVTAGLGGTFPKGLLIGTVIKVVRDDASGSASAWVRPAAELGRLEEVLCLPSAGR